MKLQMPGEHHAIKLGSSGFQQGTREIQSTYPVLQGMIIVTEIINTCSTAPIGERPEAKADPRRQLDFNCLDCLAVFADVISPT